MNSVEAKIRKHPHIIGIMSEAQVDNPELAIRILARRLLNDSRLKLELDKPPFDLELIASLRGIKICDEHPEHSEDAELIPTESGIIKMRINREKPRVRQRFSIGHELGHTLFPDYKLNIQRRHKPTSFDSQSIAKEIERLCDIAASEFVLPMPWFEEDILLVNRAEHLVDIAGFYESSRDATVRRFVEIASEPHAAVYFEWKLKPTQEKELIRDKDQAFMFDIDPVAEAEKKKCLRVKYSVTNQSFENKYGKFIPANKSIKESTLIQKAAVSNECKTGVDYIDLGSISGSYNIWAIPLFTPEDKYGPAKECAVVSVLSKN